MQRYEYKQGEPCSADGEWYEGELRTIVMDKCSQTCKQIALNRAKGFDTFWWDESLLCDDTLCSEVCDKIGGTLVEVYNVSSSGGISFDFMVDECIKQIVDGNRYTNDTKNKGE
jgi:hypothetical protein